MISQRFREWTESVVGPIQASEARKDRMREELLSHLASRFEEERASTGGDDSDDATAAERAVARMGEPGELTRSLQASVPAWERTLFARLFPHHRFEDWGQRRDGEPAWHHAARATLLITTTIVLADLIVLPIAWAGRSRPVDWPVVLVWAPATLGAVALGCFLGLLLCAGATRALESTPPQWRRATLYGLLSSLLAASLFGGFALTVAIGAPHGQVFQASDWLRVAPMIVLAPVVLFVSANESIARRRRRGQRSALDTSTTLN